MNSQQKAFEEDIEVRTANANKAFYYRNQKGEIFGVDKLNYDEVGTFAKPKHYSKGIDTFERMEKNCNLSERLAFVKGNIDKYNWRDKGQDREDFEKIINYAQWALKQIDNETV